MLLRSHPETQPLVLRSDSHTKLLRRLRQFRHPAENGQLTSQSAFDVCYDLRRFSSYFAIFFECI